MRRFDKAMTYGCPARHDVRTVYLEVGLEGGGSDHLPVPMFIGRCSTCGQSVGHIDWHLDVTFDPPLEALPPTDGIVPYFRMPNRKERRRDRDQACGVPMNRPAEWIGLAL